MGLLKHFKSKQKLEESSRPESYYPPPAQAQSRYQQPAARYGQPDLTSRLPDKVLAKIFIYVCPHTRDTSFLPSEDSQIGDGCMLCDLRDLAKCAQVSRKWYSVAQGLLYTSVRIDAVHYCDLEDELAERRKKAAKKFRSKDNVEPVDIPNIRLRFLGRTVRENPQLGAQVQILKVPYMTRETAKGDLAQVAGALPNLQYLDLPDGFYSGDPTCMTLRQELQSRCPEIRKMTYKSGSEEALELLAQRHWQRIETLEISGLSIDPASLRIVFASLPTLHELTMSDMSWMDDTIFQQSPGQLPDFPPLHSLKMTNIPRVTARGLTSYLQPPYIRDALSSLNLKNTGITVAELPSVLASATSLEYLSISEVVAKSLGFNVQDLPPLASPTLRSLHYEVTSSDEVHGLQKPHESYYFYLASAIHRNALPSLSTVYVRDQKFPDLLLQPPLPSQTHPAQRPAYGAGSDSGSLKSNNSRTSNNPFLTPPLGTGAAPPRPQTQTLEVFAKGADDVEWLFTSISPSLGTSGQRGSVISVGGGRPVSAMAGVPQWAQGGFGGDARKSVVVGNGFGGFLAIPQDSTPARPVSEGYGQRWASQSSAASGGSAFLKAPQPGFATESKDKRKSKMDIWR